MAEVTAVRPARRRAAYFELELDGVAIGTIPERLVEAYGLAVGVVLDEDTAAALRHAAQLAAALSLANGFLAHRPRSEAEVRQRLTRAGFEDGTVAAAVETLMAQGLLDDQRFASLWVESRRSFSPRSSRLLAMELRHKGVGRAEIDEVLAEAGGDEVAQAVAAGRQRLRAFASLDADTFKRRMGGYLARRGFAFQDAAPAVTALWQELHPED